MRAAQAILAMNFVRSVVNKGFGWAMILVLALIIAGVWILMKTESRLGWVVLAVAGFVGYVALKHYNMI